MSFNPEEDPAKLIKTETVSDTSLHGIIKKVISQNKDVLKKHNSDKILMGLVMKEVRGKIPGSEVARALAKELKKK
ncbi:hypothetical protein ACFLQO_00545 [Candidatus Aenigmatarchaeota archaeon]